MLRKTHRLCWGKPLDYAKESVQNKWMREEVQRIGYPTIELNPERGRERERERKSNRKDILPSFKDQFKLWNEYIFRNINLFILEPNL